MQCNAMRSDWSGVSGFKQQNKAEQNNAEQSSAEPGDSTTAGARARAAALLLPRTIEVPSTLTLPDKVTPVLLRALVPDAVGDVGREKPPLVADAKLLGGGEKQAALLVRPRPHVVRHARRGVPVKVRVRVLPQRLSRRLLGAVLARAVRLLEAKLAAAAAGPRLRAVCRDPARRGDLWLDPAGEVAVGGVLWGDAFGSPVWEGEGRGMEV